MLLLAAIIAEQAMTRLTADVIKFLYNKCEPQGHIDTTYKKFNKMISLNLLHT